MGPRHVAVEGGEWRSETLKLKLRTSYEKNKRYEVEEGERERKGVGGEKAGELIIERL